MSADQFTSYFPRIKQEPPDTGYETNLHSSPSPYWNSPQCAPSIYLPNNGLSFPHMAPVSTGGYIKPEPGSWMGCGGDNTPSHHQPQMLGYPAAAASGSAQPIYTELSNVQPDNVGHGQTVRIKQEPIDPDETPYQSQSGYHLVMSAPSNTDPPGDYTRLQQNGGMDYGCVGGGQVTDLHPPVANGAAPYPANGNSFNNGGIHGNYGSPGQDPGNYSTMVPVKMEPQAIQQNGAGVKTAPKAKRSAGGAGAKRKIMKQEKITDTFKVRKKHDRFHGIPESEILLKTLPDHVAHDLDILLVGINPGLFAAYKGHHYAGPGNHFWKCLFLSGLVPEQMTCLDDHRLLNFGIGFTNMVERTSRGSADLTRKEIKEGCKDLLVKVDKYKPKIAAFNGKCIYEIFSQMVFDGNKVFAFGLQGKKIPGTDTYIYVMPSSSARCSQFPRAQDKVPYYAELRNIRDKIREGNLLDLDEATEKQRQLLREAKIKKEAAASERLLKKKAAAAIKTEPGLGEVNIKQEGGVFIKQEYGAANGGAGLGWGPGLGTSVIDQIPVINGGFPVKGEHLEEVHPSELDRLGLPKN